jgi:hypothetical protein
MGKKYEASAKLVDKPTYTVAEAMPLVKKAAFAKFVLLHEAVHPDFGCVHGSRIGWR